MATQIPTPSSLNKKRVCTVMGIIEVKALANFEFLFGNKASIFSKGSRSFTDVCMTDTSFFLLLEALIGLRYELQFDGFAINVKNY